MSLPRVNFRGGSDCSLLGPAGLLGAGRGWFLLLGRGWGGGVEDAAVHGHARGGVGGEAGDPPLLSQAGQLGPSWAACLHAEARGWGGGPTRASSKCN